MIEEVIDEIGRLADKVDSDKWAVAEAVYDAYSELPEWEDHLTRGIKTRLKLSSYTQVYNYREAWEMKLGMFGNFGLSVSHLSRAKNLQDKFGLSGSEIQEYLEMAKEEGWSVAKLEQEISGNHDPNQEEKERKQFEKMVKQMRLCWTYPIMNDVREEIRKEYYHVLKNLEAHVNQNTTGR